MSVTALAVCSCARRIEAQASGEFVFLTDYHAWAFTSEDLPRRAMTWRARYYLRPGEPDHTGEPFRHYDCPYCGTALPDTLLDAIREGDSCCDPDQ